LETKKFYLVTTSDERTWRPNEPTLFLGLWCLLSQRESVWSKMDYEVLTHHWLSSSTMLTESCVVREIYETILAKLTLVLNNHHTLEWGERSWRILIGPWLQKFIQVSYDRWRSIDYVVNNFHIYDTSVHPSSPIGLYTESYTDLSAKAKTDQWNKALYDQAIIINGAIKYTLNYNKETKPNTIRRGILGSPIAPWLTISFNTSLFKSALQWVLGKFKKGDRLGIVEAYFPRWMILRLKLNNRSLPIPDYTADIPDLKGCQLDTELRKRLFFTEGQGGVKEFIERMLPYALPSIYLERFNALNHAVAQSALPSNPSVIITSVAQWHDEVFKLWVAKIIEGHTKVVVVQHGAEYGTSAFHFFEEHERKISDKYLVWGWGGEDQKLGLISPPFARKRAVLPSRLTGRVLIVLRCTQRYLSQMHPGLLFADKSLYYINLVEKLLRRLSCEEKIQIWVRFFPGDNELPNALGSVLTSEGILISKEGRLRDAFRKSSLIIHTYDGTPFLESLSIGKPSVLLFDPNLTQLRVQARPYYETLIQNKIAHRTVEELCGHVLGLDGEFQTWWDSKAIRLARKKYSHNYAYGRGEYLNELQHVVEGLRS